MRFRTLQKIPAITGVVVLVVVIGYFGYRGFRYENRKRKHIKREEADFFSQMHYRAAALPITLFLHSCAYLVNNTTR